MSVSTISKVASTPCPNLARIIARRNRSLRSLCSDLIFLDSGEVLSANGLAAAPSAGRRCGRLGGDGGGGGIDSNDGQDELGAS